MVMIRMSEAPTVFCPKEGKKVPIWYCMGSFVQQRKPCPHMVKLAARFSRNHTEDHAEVECDYTQEVKT